MLVAAIALCLSQAPAAWMPAAQPEPVGHVERLAENAQVSDAPLVSADAQLQGTGGGMLPNAFLTGVVEEELTAVQRVERKRTWGAVLFWTGAGILASGMYLIVQSAQGPEPMRPMFGKQAVVTSTAGVALLAGGVGLNISADYDLVD